MIPEFEPGGNLPPGVYDATWSLFSDRFGANHHRRHLLSGLKRALDSLKVAGCANVFVDGSFVTRKDLPEDYDACWDPVGVDPLLLDPILLRFENQRRLQKIMFFGELFPSSFPATLAGMRFLEFFQRDRDTGSPKGIVRLKVQDLP